MKIQNVYADSPVSTNVGDPLNSKFQNIGDIAGWVINIMLGVGWALTFIMLAAGFIKYILSRGETKATDQARQWLTFAALGGVGLFFLTTIRLIIQNLLGAEGGPTTSIDFFNPFGSE